MTQAAQRVLVVDDEGNMRRVLEIMLGRMGFKTRSAADGVEAFALLQEDSFDLVVSDLRMPQMNGIELLGRMRQTGIDVPTIIITAQGTIESAVEAMRLGAYDYLLRPFDVDTLELAIRRVFAQRQLLQQHQFLLEQAEASASGLIGNSPAMQQVGRQIAQVAPTRATVLITGETGTGKEVVARAIHRASGREQALFVAINCAAIPADILESELFGHEKGAFTGALKERIGKFELASGGTLFLDEITEMPIALQAKLLRVLQEGVVERVGGNRSIELDLRVVAATNRPPDQAVREQKLREDLYYRLNVFSIHLPPLRERREDVPALVRHFLGTQARAGHVPVIREAALAHLSAYDWPGNVRELQNLVERGLVLAGGQPLDVTHFPIEMRGVPAVSAPATAEIEDYDLERAVGLLESRYIREALNKTGGNKTRAAALLNISERSIWYKLKKYGLE